MQHLIGIAELVVSQKPDDILVAPNLGSCLGVAVYNKACKVGGMVHCLLPASTSDPEKAARSPSTYVDTGVALLLQKVLSFGGSKKDLIIKVAGGANINDENNVFEIGKKNYTILKKILWKNSLLIKAEHVGDNCSRTISLDVGSGNVSLKVRGETLILD